MSESEIHERLSRLTGLVRPGGLTTLVRAAEEAVRQSGRWDDYVAQLSRELAAEAGGRPPDRRELAAAEPLVRARSLVHLVRPATPA